VEVAVLSHVLSLDKCRLLRVTLCVILAGGSTGRLQYKRSTPCIRTYKIVSNKKILTFPLATSHDCRVCIANIRYWILLVFHEQATT